jgi:ribonuclease J
MLIIAAWLALGFRSRTLNEDPLAHLSTTQLNRQNSVMRVCIHRGAKQIGGTCVEIEASGSRIIVDLCLPLDAVEADLALVPQISGLREHDPSLLAIVLSHGHRDHWGLVPKVRPDIPIVMGQAAERIMRAAANFVPDAFAPKAWKYLESGKPLQIGPFAITPHLVDHSAFDAYALEIEAGGRRLFYSGDLRAHGRKSKLFELMLKRPPKNIDVMLMEGSSLGRLGDDEAFPTEQALERIFIDRFKTTPGMVLVACSAQNIDRVVTIYRAAKKTGRTLIVDAYAAEVLKATAYDSIPKPVRGWRDVAVFIPQAQRVHLKRKGIARIVDSYRGFRLWPEKLAEHAPRSVMLFRAWMLRDLERAKALAGARVIWSQWEGYLQEGGGARLKADCEFRRIPFEVIHTSGHASISDLKRLAAAVNPKALVPIHTFEAERFPELFENVILRQDREWCEV